MLPDLFRPAETRPGLAGQAGPELPAGQLFTALIRLLPAPFLVRAAWPPVTTTPGIADAPGPGAPEPGSPQDVPACRPCQGRR
jgi:hypothetical protein